MTFDGLRQTSSPAESRKSSFSELKKHKNFRRKNMQIRRIRSVSDEKSDDFLVLPDPVVSSKKMRSDVKNEIRLIEESIGVQLPGKEVTPLSHGMISVIGRRREMEDAVAVELNFLKKGGKSYDFFGVYDGHGGWRVAQACSEMLHKVLVEIVEEHTIGEEMAWGSLMAAGFRKMDEEVNKDGADATTGSTAVVAVVGEEVVVVANCGDSRAVLCRGGVAVQLSDDHKPDRPDELERIEASGGKVINWNGHRILGVLATSRSIGDEYLKPFVITDPEVKIINRTKWDEFLVLGSDGLWDVISNDVACKIVRRCLDGQMRSWKKGNDHGCNESRERRSAEAAALLAELAMAKGSNDNITVVVVDLKTCRSNGLAC